MEILSLAKQRLKYNFRDEFETTIECCQKIINCRVIGVRLLLWPPIEAANLDPKYEVITEIELNLSNGTEEFWVRVNSESNGWSIQVYDLNICTNPKIIYSINQFENRLKYWSNLGFECLNDDLVLDMEYFQVDSGDLFKLLNQRILRILFFDVKLEALSHEINPYGIKFEIEGENSICSFSNTYGNFIQINDFMKFHDIYSINSFLGETIVYELD